MGIDEISLVADMMKKSTLSEGTVDRTEEGTILERQNSSSGNQSRTESYKDSRRSSFSDDSEDFELPNNKHNNVNMSCFSYESQRSIDSYLSKATLGMGSYTNSLNELRY